MSAEVLRRAAALMRERAEAADATETWDWRSEAGDAYWANGTRAGEHIQSWRPAVALAVADWLDHYACVLEVDNPIAFAEDAIAVARAYLGESA